MREFTAVIVKDHGSYSASCHELGVHRIHGDTVDEARDRLISAMQRHVDDLCESGPVNRTPESLVCTDAITQLPLGAAILITVPEYLITRN